MTENYDYVFYIGADNRGRVEARDTLEQSSEN